MNVNFSNFSRVIEIDGLKHSVDFREMKAANGVQSKEYYGLIQPPPVPDAQRRDMGRLAQAKPREVEFFKITFSQDGRPKLHMRGNEQVREIITKVFNQSSQLIISGMGKDGAHFESTELSDEEYQVLARESEGLFDAQIFENKPTEEEEEEDKAEVGEGEKGAAIGVRGKLKEHEAAQKVRALKGEVSAEARRQIYETQQRLTEKSIEQQRAKERRVKEKREIKDRQKGEDIEKDALKVEGLTREIKEKKERT